MKEFDKKGGERMKLGRQDVDGFDIRVDELEMLLGEIPHATSPHQQHHHHHHHLEHGHGNVSGSAQTIFGVNGDDPSPFHWRAQKGHTHSGSGHLHDGHGHFSSPAQSILAMYDNDPSSFPGYACVSPVSGVSLPSSSSSLSGRLSPDDRGSPPSPLPVKYPNPPRKTQYPNGFVLSQESEPPDNPARRNADKSFTDDFSLSNKLWKMDIGDGEDDMVKFEKLASCGNAIDSYGSRFSDWRLGGHEHGNVVMKNTLEDCKNAFSNYYGRLRCSNAHNSSGNLSGSNFLSHPARYTDPMNYPWNQVTKYVGDDSFSNLQGHSEVAFGVNYCPRGIHVPNVAATSINRPSFSDMFFHSQKNGNDSTVDWGLLDSQSSPHVALPKVASPLHNNSHVISDRGQFSNGWTQQSPHSMRRVPDLEAFTCEDSLIIQGKDFNCGLKGRRDFSRECQNWEHDAISLGQMIDRNSKLDGRLQSSAILAGLRSPVISPNYSSLMELKGYINLIAKDQYGCRFLQRIFDGGNPRDVQMIFDEIIDNVVELMMNSFGNYLMQKLLEICTERQRMHILLVVTARRGQLVRISLNTHGTRAVQKLIETLKNREEISLVISALEPGFLDLIKDLNGNHVVQRCLQCFSADDNKFIFDAAAKYCVDIATHRHGCCVLQRCIAYSTGEQTENLVAEISANGLLLAQDPFGNYVVQFILESKTLSAMQNLESQFEGNYVHLSTQKFSSNVVEKCLKLFGEEGRSRIIHELLSTSRFEQLLQDPYANYVIQCALVVSKGPLHASLVEAIRPHAAILRTSPYCKRIFSRALSKK